MNTKKSATVEKYNGRPTILLNGQPVTPIIYALPDTPGGNWSFDSVPKHNLELFHGHGVKLYQVDLFFDHIWMSENEWSLDLAQRQLRGVLDICSDAAIFIRLHANPPEWWTRKHPETWTVYEEGEAEAYSIDGAPRLMDADPRQPARPSMASHLWRDTMAEKIERFCKELANTPEGDSVVGMHIAYGVYGEWHQWGLFTTDTDQSDAMADDYRKWLKTNYGTIESLNRAWDTDFSSFSEIDTPKPGSTPTTTDGVFRYGPTVQPSIDYGKAAQQCTADAIIHFCKTLKTAWPRDLVVGIFYGYFFGVFSRHVVAGHMAIESILNSEWIDYLSGPNVYEPVSGYLPGEPFRSRCLNDFIRDSGKLWLDEYDQEPKRNSPFLEFKDNRENYFKDMIANVAMIRRNILYSQLKGQGYWYYDFGPSGMMLNPKNELNLQAGTSRGYWDHPLYHSEIKELHRVSHKLAETAYTNPSEILVVYDTEVLYQQSADKVRKCKVTDPCVDQLTASLFYTGAPFRTTHRLHLGQVDLENVKAIIFANTFQLTASERTLIRERMAQSGRHLIWVYAPGYLDKDAPSLEAMHELTGFSFEKEIDVPNTDICLSEAWIGSEQAIKGMGEVALRFSIRDIDPDTAIHGTWASNGKAAFASRAEADSTQWFMGTPICEHSQWRELFAQVGLHSYHQTADVIYAGNGALLLHTRNGGKKSFNLRNGQAIRLDLPETPQTVLLDEATGEYLIPPYELG